MPVEISFDLTFSILFCIGICVIWGKSSRFLYSLIDNAIKFSHNGGVILYSDFCPAGKGIYLYETAESAFPKKVSRKSGIGFINPIPPAERIKKWPGACYSQRDYPVPWRKHRRCQHSGCWNRIYFSVFEGFRVKTCSRVSI